MKQVWLQTYKKLSTIEIQTPELKSSLRTDNFQADANQLKKNCLQHVQVEPFVVMKVGGRTTFLYSVWLRVKSH
jgi:hypothetical protein